MTSGSTTWSFTYNADGLRTQKSNGTTTYNYIYNGSSLSQMSVGNDTLRFFYDANGVPVSVDYNGTAYYYATNIQGDIVAILDATGVAVVEYTYDAWGRHLAASGSLHSTLGIHNPLRYRGYVYDQEIGLYYLQSRYYNPYTGRFINADAYAATGQGLLGNNMFAYCANNPVMYSDPTGYIPWMAIDFFLKWLNGDGATQYYSGWDRMVGLLRENNKLKKIAENALEQYKAGKGNTVQGTLEFTSNEDGDELYLSTQHCNYTMTAKLETYIEYRWAGLIMFKIESHRYVVNVTVYDKYNFDSLREWNSFGNMMNNLALIYDWMIGGNDFEWYASYTLYYETVV